MGAESASKGVGKELVVSGVPEAIDIGLMEVGPVAELVNVGARPRIS